MKRSRRRRERKKMQGKYGDRGKGRNGAEGGGKEHRKQDQ